MDYALTTQGLTKTYAQTKALNGLTMHVPKGAIYGFVGKNGAGKTTLIRLVCGLQAPTAGDYTLYGVPHTAPEIHKARRRMGAVVETPSVYLDLTAADNLKLQYRLLGLPSEEGIPELLHLVGLGDTGKKKARHFSLGMRQRLGIAVALCGDPDFLILDEPINGLDPQGIIEMRELILRLNREHQITVLISSHILDELARLATHYGFIDKGRMVEQLSMDELQDRCRECLELTVDPPHRDQRRCPLPSAGPAGHRVPPGRGRGGGRLRGGKPHPADPGPQSGRMPGHGPAPAGREPGELLHQPGGR